MCYVYTYYTDITDLNYEVFKCTLGLSGEPCHPVNVNYEGFLMGQKVFYDFSKKGS